jgi:hypothetical protein
MSSPLLRVAALAAGLSLLLGAATAGTALADPAAAAGPAARVVPAAARGGAPPASAVLTLLNGDRLLTGSAGGGRPPDVVLRSPGSGLAGSLVTLGLGSRKLLIPLAALPFVGKGLDPRLFDVGALRRAERDGRLPVTIRSRGLPPTLPGMTVTSRATGIEQGYFTASSARAFGAALARQLTRDHARSSYGTDGLFAGGVSVSLPGTAPARARPHLPMHTLTVTGTNSAGKADTGDIVFVLKVSSPAASFQPMSSFDHGIVKYSVPSGTYWAIGAFNQQFDHGHLANSRLDVLPQFTVRGNQTVHLDARAATSKIAITTPRPAVIRSEGLTVIRSAPGADASSLGWLVPFAGDSIFVNPVRRHPADGTLRSFTFAQLTSRQGRGTPYAYALNFAGRPGTIPSQRFTTHPADLATISERYFQDRRTTGGWEIAGGTPAEINAAGTDTAPLPVQIPFRRVLYVSARPAMLWQLGYLAYRTIRAGQTNGGQTSEPLLLHPGQHLSEAWNENPLHPASNVSFPGTGPSAVRSSADRAGNTLNLDVTPFSDNQRGHVGHGLLADLPGRSSPLRGSYALFQNGARIAGGDARKVTGGFGDVQVSARLKPGPSVVKFVLTASRASAQFRLSAASRDEWTWRTRQRPGALLPRPWLCDFTAQNRRRCAVEPMMTLNYQVARLGLNGRTRPGRQSISLTAGHIQLARDSRITRAAVSVSYDGGKTWHKARVARISGKQFRATFTARAGATVTMRTTAADAAGATITETITGAYQTS